MGESVIGFIHSLLSGIDWAFSVGDYVASIVLVLWFYGFGLYGLKRSWLSL